MESEGLFIKTNSDNTDITDELFNENYKNYTDPFDIQFFKNEKVINEIKETFLDFYNTVPYIQRCVDKDKPRAKDLPRDNKGRIIVDITRPHHLEDMDYFRPTAICFEKHGALTLLKPNGNPNSPYGKWIAEEARRCREGYIRESDGEWIPGDLYFFWNYCPMLMEDYDEEEGITVRKRSFPHMWEGHYYKFHYVWQARRNNMNSAELASRAKGKAHPYSQVVYTPEGKKLWGDIKVGDNLFGDDGNITKVTQIPFDAEEDIYTVSLADGRKFQCTTGHLFYVKDSRKANPMRVASLLEIMESDYAHKRRNGMIEYYYSIPKNGKVEFSEKKTTIDPYTLGLLIGDGGFTKISMNVASFTSRDEDIELYEKVIPYKIKKYKQKYSFGILIDNLGKYIKEYGLSGLTSSHKFIPEDYLFNTSSVRKAVLQGLLDTDGTVNNSGVPMFTTVSEQLANDVRWLCYSLGYNNTMFVKQGKYKDKDGIVHICKKSYNITILTNDDVFRLPRKLCKLDGFHSSYGRSRRDWTKIVNIEYSHREKAKCVIVDNDSHCYLIGDFIVTHNTASAAAMLTRRIELGETSKNKSDVTCIAMASDKKFLTGGDVLLDKFQDNLDFCAEYTEFPRGRIKDTENDLKWEIGYKQNNGPKSGVQNVVLGISSGNSPKKGRGSRAALYIMEEFGSWPNLKTTYSSLRKSVKNGKNAYGLIHLQGCVCAGTKVWDKNNNLVNIENITDNIKGYDGNHSSIEDVTYLQPEAYKKCLKITTTNGVLECSVDHPLLTYKNKKASFYRANELKVGDRLLMHGNDSFGSIHEKDAFLLGALYGDGNYTKNSCVTLSINTPEEYNFYNDNYDINISKLRIDKEFCYAQIYFRKMHEKLKEYGMDNKSKDEKCYPNNIFLWDKESISNFISGYYNADGNIQIVKNKHRAIKLTCKYKDSLEIMQKLLMKFNIMSYILKEHKEDRALHSKVNNMDYHMKASDCYVLYICNGNDIVRFRENFHFLINEKQERLDSYELQNSRNDFKSLEFKYREDNCKGKYFINRTLYNLRGTKILSIENIGIKRIYNLTANATHTYLTNDFISSNTAGDNESDFSSAQDLVRNPDGNDIYALDNVYDKVSQGKRRFPYFFPAYINLIGHYDKDGNSDVVSSLLQIISNRIKIKYNTENPETLIKETAEMPIVPEEAMMRTTGNVFPTTQLNERIGEIEGDPNFFDSTFVGKLVMDSTGNVKFESTVDVPIRFFPHNDNKLKGALEIFEMPQIDPNTKRPFANRYIASQDPVDRDVADTVSLSATFVMDLWTDRIVAEWTGRTQFAEDGYENARLLCMFYNCKLLYENNIAGLYGYFQKMNCLSMLEETPPYLKEKDLVKTLGFGNTAYGVRTTVPIINHGERLIEAWLLAPVKTVDKNGNTITLCNINFIKNLALLKELVMYNRVNNFDRVMALVMLMIFREAKMIMYHGDVKQETRPKGSEAAHDKFFQQYDRKFKHN